MSSPTPSVDSLPGVPQGSFGSFLEVNDGLLNGLDLTNGCHGSSSSSTCSSIIFPHLNLSNGVVLSGYGGSPSEFNNRIHSPIVIPSQGVSPKSNTHHSNDRGGSGSIAARMQNFCTDCSSDNKNNIEGDGCNIKWDEPQNSQSYTATVELLNSFETASSRLQTQYIKAQNEISEAFSFYRGLLDERRNDLLKELESIYTSRQVTLSVVTQRVQESLDQMCQAVEFGDRLLRDASPPQVLVFKKLLETRLQSISATVQQPTIAMAAAATKDIEFVANFSAMQTAVRNTLGYIRVHDNTIIPPSIGGNNPGGNIPPPPISRPLPTLNGYHSNNGHNLINNSSQRVNNPSPQHQQQIPKRTSTPISSSYNHQIDLSGISTYEKWSNGTETNYQNGVKDYHTSPEYLQPQPLSSSSSHHHHLPSIPSSSSSANGIDYDQHQPISKYPKPPSVKRGKMIYHCKFGEFGTGESQFTEPSGVCVNVNNEIIVADTNNHRIQIFDREGRFKFQFGECGKRDGQLLYPNRVAVVKSTGDVIVTERSPTHQIQIYNQYGQFIRKFGANILQHPRGVTVDSKGRIIVVECKVMRVIIFDQIGTVLHKFGCSKHLEFPNGVVVNDHQEIFISDNRAHCVKVFNYDGIFLRQIGGEGLTNYPIGVGINENGEILVADNHNNFNLTIFTQDGHLVSALESKVKHAQCFDVALMDGSVVLASKDYRLYIYSV